MEALKLSVAGGLPGPLIVVVSVVLSFKILTSAAAFDTGDVRNGCRCIARHVHCQRESRITGATPSTSLRVHGPAGCVHVQPLPANDVGVNPMGTRSPTVTVPLVGAVPEFVTVIVYVAPVSPCVKFPLSVLTMVRSGTGVPAGANLLSTFWVIVCTAGLNRDGRCAGAPQSSSPQVH